MGGGGLTGDLTAWWEGELDRRMSVSSTFFAGVDIGVWVVSGDYDLLRNISMRGGRRGGEQRLTLNANKQRVGQIERISRGWVGGCLRWDRPWLVQGHLGSEAPAPLREELASTVGGRCDLLGPSETKNNHNRILIR